MKEINLNDIVLIRVNTSGWIVFNEYYKNLGLNPNDYKRIYEQPDGKLEMTLWQVMKIFGNAVGSGFEPPIELKLEVFER